jgi:predicted ABC-type ATPase
MTKWMWIIAGPNGAGKTTVATKILKNLGVEGLQKLNADDRTLELRVLYPEKSQNELNLLAAQQIDAEVLANIRAGESFFVETVLSSPKYREAVTEAKKQGYMIGLIYVSLHPPELSPERIKLRVIKGGHDVDEAKAIARYHRSHEQLRWFAKQATTFVALDNSDPTGKPVLIAAKLAGKALTHNNKDVNPAVDRVIYALKKKKYPVPTAKVG